MRNPVIKPRENKHSKNVFVLYIFWPPVHGTIDRWTTGEQRVTCHYILEKSKIPMVPLLFFFHGALVGACR